VWVFNGKHTKEKRLALRREQTKAEQMLWAKLRAGRFQKLKFFRQYGIGGYIADFYCPAEKLVIEVDGGQHFDKAAMEYDDEREKYMEALGIKTIRFNNHEVLTKIEVVLDVLERAITNSPQPPLYKRGGAESGTLTFVKRGSAAAGES
jgi:very-short-patch-repair endonuclease